MLLINHMVLQLQAGREQKVWQPFGDWHLVSESHSFCSSLSAHFHPSIPSLFNWLSVKVPLSASTCPCHSKQRQPGDTLSVLSYVCTLFSPAYFSYFLLFCLLLPTPPLFFPWYFSFSLFHSLFLFHSDLSFLFLFHSVSIF